MNWLKMLHTVVIRVIAVLQSFSRAAAKSGEKRDSST